MLASLPNNAMRRGYVHPCLCTYVGRVVLSFTFWQFILQRVGGIHVEQRMRN